MFGDPGVEEGVILNRFSSKLTQVKSQGASQAMLFATGITKDDMNKAQVCADAPRRMSR